MALLEYVFGAVILVLAVVIIYLIRASKGRAEAYAQAAVSTYKIEEGERMRKSRDYA